ncbi:MAG: homocysteine S-methyltransferase [Pelagibacteraceae bacterium]|jgi:homocysteine S-methyltransferase|nr:homocysteine S-methyltransferase [Pelagibacteraceae bacterium]|tara:strand:- start:1 stop:915 length:915 start_codon:yes stop_codon:yes gene_type:complete
MDINYFKSTRILDGGMGQELLHKGLKPKGTLWSAHALIDEDCHQLVIDTHLDFINAGAEVIVTSTFTARRNRLIQNDCEKYFEKINIKAVELAQKARDISKKEVLIAGGLPNQKQTYSADLGENLGLIERNFYDQAKLLKNGIDFFYLDVMSSGMECKIALKTIESFNLPVLVGTHLRDNGQLPSGETIKDIVKKYKNNNWLGIITACVSPKAYEVVINDLQKLNMPYGFKLNAFKKIPEGYTVASKDQWGDAGNPNTVLGVNTDLNESMFSEYVKKFMENGATILGGCCEIRPSHIKEISKLK